jgi:hypothetical protein
MGVNRAVEAYLMRHVSGWDDEKKASHLKSELSKIPVKKKLSDMTLEDWGPHTCLSCKWWIALSKERHLGECHNSSARRGHKNPEIPEYTLTPPHDFCRHHWGRGEAYTSPTWTPTR